MKYKKMVIINQKFAKMLMTQIKFQCGPKNETLMSNYYTIEEIEEILSGKTNIDSVYTKDETYNKDEVYNVSQIDFLLKLKVNKVDVYSKIDMNTLLDLKANKNEIYDKNEIDEILGSYYTKIEIDTILENKA